MLEFISVKNKIVNAILTNILTNGKLSCLAFLDFDTQVEGYAYKQPICRIIEIAKKKHKDEIKRRTLTQKKGIHWCSNRNFLKL